ncbi:hypothetical protein CC2G_009568 [Coprinopsis cinerea AmutBmut pab1-1]|nr:hypothetical protein CC2G_009568 [Coprinopsis cinerea AmutBmut pab1-1]
MQFPYMVLLLDFDLPDQHRQFAIALERPRRRRSSVASDCGGRLTHSMWPGAAGFGTDERASTVCIVHRLVFNHKSWLMSDWHNVPSMIASSSSHGTFSVAQRTFFLALNVIECDSNPHAADTIARGRANHMEVIYLWPLSCGLPRQRSTKLVAQNHRRKTCSDPLSEGLYALGVEWEFFSYSPSFRLRPNP